MCGGGRSSGAPAQAADLAWLPACGTVGGFVSTQVCAGACASSCHLDDLVTLHCSAMSCGAAMHRTPPPPGARLMCHWHINLTVLLVGQRDEIYPPHPDLIYKR